MIKFAICDDDNKIIESMKYIVCDYQNNKDTEFEIHTFQDGRELIASLCNFDLIFLDIEMPHLDGIRAAKKIRETDKNVRFVYVTSHSKYALYVFAIHPFDFALKPINSPKIFSILDEFTKYYIQNDNEEKGIFKNTNGTTILNLKDVIAFEYANNRRILVHMKYKQEEIKGSITEIMHTINSEHFASPHKSFVINLREVIKISDFTIFMSDGVQIPVAQKRLRSFQKVLSLYMHKYLIKE